jgi:hypothetical protein
MKRVEGLERPMSSRGGHFRFSVLASHSSSATHLFVAAIAGRCLPLAARINVQNQ